MACVYILFSEKTKKFYTGASTYDTPLKRLAEHNRGKTKSTKSGIPWNIVHQEKFESYADALKREKQLKTGRGRKWIYGQWGYLKGENA